MTLKNGPVLTIGVDLGGTNLRVAAYTPDRGVLNSLSLRTRLEAGPFCVVDDICGAINQLVDQHSDGRVLVGVGVGSPGPLELPAGRLHHPPNLPGWDGFPLLNEMEKRLSRPVVLESDATSPPWRNLRWGSARLLELTRSACSRWGPAWATESF